MRNKLVALIRTGMLSIFFVISTFLSRPLEFPVGENLTLLILSSISILILIYHGQSNQRAPSKNSFIKPLSLFAVAMMFSRIMQGDSFGIDSQTIVLIMLPLMTYLFSRLDDKEIYESIALSLPVYCLIGTYIGINDNVFSFTLIGLTVFTLGNFNQTFVSWIILILSGILAYTHTCIGALVSSSSMFLIRVLEKNEIKYKLSFAALICTFYFLSLILGRYFAGYFHRNEMLLRDVDYLHYRDFLIIDGAKKFLMSPIFGIGTDEYQIALPHMLKKAEHAHCFPISILAESGIIGFSILIYVSRVIYKRWLFLPFSSKITLTLYGFWSLVDEPLRLWGGALLFCLALSRESTKKMYDNSSSTYFNSVSAHALINK